jgi:hypothetical protein
MIKVVYKYNTDLSAFFNNFDELGAAFKTVAGLSQKSVLGFVLEHYDLYVEGVEYTC